MEGFDPPKADYKKWVPKRSERLVGRRYEQMADGYRYMGLKKLCKKLFRWAQECPRFTTRSGIGPAFL